jgi:hypothetical protein
MEIRYIYVRYAKTTNKHELLLRSVNITNFTEYFGCPKDLKIARDLSLLGAQMSD